MVTIRSVNEIIANLISYFNIVQPNADTKPGTVIRDLFIEAQASQLSLLYDQIANISNANSMRLVVGSDLDKLAKNYGLVRRQSTPSAGVALYTFSSINYIININSGDTVTSNNGISFTVSNGIAVDPINTNYYKSIASQYSTQLNSIGINDIYAAQVTVQANTYGSSGNIGAYSLNTASSAGVNNVTNINAFTGGTDQETDATFRARILAAFNGASIGTSLGYLNAAIGTTGVEDAYIIQPGDPLMTRDGSLITTNSDGSQTVIVEGSGGKVDVSIMGSNLIQNKESYIYIDKSNNNDPTNSKNNYVLGQILADVNKTINTKRVDDILNTTLPNQPIGSMLQVTGSLSGSNFIQATTNINGITSGNYKIIKDTGIYAGSPWGFDTFHWIDNKISNYSESKVKGQNNGQDPTNYSDVLSISIVQQNINIVNENSTILSSNKSIIQLLHVPAVNITRVFNINTGERYVITNQNYDNTGTLNTSGRIQISGNTLPSTNDILQVDYTWLVTYDNYHDYDGLYNTHNIRTVNDSIDWGYSSLIKNEEILFTANPSKTFFVGTSSQPINTVIYANKFTQVNGTIIKITSGTFNNRLAIQLTNLSSSTDTIDSITFNNTNTELYNTAQNNGIFSTVSVVVGINIYYNTLIILPSDTVGIIDDTVSIILNSVNVFNGTMIGNSSGSQITIPYSSVNTTATNIILRVSYIANITNLLLTATNNLPISRLGNGYTYSNVGFNNFSRVNNIIRENQIVQKNLSNQFYVQLNLTVSDYSIITSQVLAVIRLSDFSFLWKENHVGSVNSSNASNYQLILNGYNSPVIGDQVLIVYYASDINRFQPFSYQNIVVDNKIDYLKLDSTTNQFYVPINEFSAQVSGINFSIIEPYTDIIINSVSDGYLTTDGYLSSLTNFNTIANLLNKKIKIVSATNPNNDGIYDIIAYNALTNQITISHILNKLTYDNISIVRILDGKEIWNYNGTITNDKLLIANAVNVLLNDAVYVILYKFKALRESPTRVISTISDQASNSGSLTITGTTLTKAQDIVFICTGTGLTIDITSAILTALNITTVPTNINLARIVKLEKVITDNTINNNVIEVLNSYDLQNTTINNNLLYPNELLENNTLPKFTLVLPNTINNTLNIAGSNNLPTLGDYLRITFYYSKDNVSENLIYTRNGTLYTNNKFVEINNINITSGIISQSANFTATSFMQPNIGSKYTAVYNYTAPKQNERISLTYTYNKLITDVTFAIESARPISNDVLVKEANKLLLNLQLNIVININYLSSSTLILQNIRNVITTALTANTLGQTIDTTTLINIAESVTGVDRARIVSFTKNGIIGQWKIIKALNNQYFVPNIITINSEVR